MEKGSKLCDVLLSARRTSQQKDFKPLSDPFDFDPCLQSLKMVLLINGVPIDDAPRDMNNFFHQFPHFKESASALCSMKPQVVGPLSLLYIFQREFGVTYPHDNKISILGTDDVTTSHIIVLRHTGSGATGISQIDRVFEEGLSTMIQRIQALSYHYDGRLELHIIGGFADTKGISHQLSTSLLQCLHKLRAEMDLITCTVNELCTIHRNGMPWPVIYGIGVNAKTGDIFPATFTDKGPDLDIRNARTLTGGDTVGMLEVYDCTREELRIGPFSYGPMRSVDLLLQQSDDFLRQNLSTSPEVAPPLFVPHLRSTLKRIKDDPYPSVTLFHSNLPRFYRKDDISGQWLRYQKEDVVPWSPISQTSTQAYY
eukprot:TCALIF_07677-PA protein Name:"Similar to NTAN1 Protein N-terminal asparagine amidohydrolase (Homo sapiens)" AED:0.20 eAED:0.20 QI:0/0.8/0.66/1/0.4/0.66/6/190/368